jgi:hypothetical protein
MSRNFFATIDDFEKFTGRKSTPVLIFNLRQIGWGFRQRICTWAISFAADAMAARAIGFIRCFANVLGLLRVREKGSSGQYGTKYGASYR